jgi:mono/diheme cytochrome c family protein
MRGPFGEWIGQEAHRVKSGLSLPSALRHIAATNMACALVALLAGCNTNITGSYPAELTYPARSDRLVLEKPPDEQFYPDQPGTMEQVANKIGVSKEDGGIGGKAINPADAPAEKRQELNVQLRDYFGTPAEPTVTINEALATGILEDLNEDKDTFGVSEFKKENLESLKLDKDSLKEGSQLYRRYCLTCHGVAGDGRGPTGPWVNPHPRDYRQGIFKFLSTDPANLDDRKRKPHRADLHRTLVTGVDGTTMPSFALLLPDQLDNLVSYVIHLSIRGEVEAQVLQSLVPGGPVITDQKEGVELTAVDKLTRYHVKDIVGNWTRSNLAETVVKPALYDSNPDLQKNDDQRRFGPVNETERRESVRNGYLLFTNSTPETDPKPFAGVGACLRCHQDFGRQANFQFDQWGTLVRAANLTLSSYRGGRRPLDLYWRIYCGIGSHMPRTDLKREEADKEGNKVDKPDGKKYWDLVNFVLALPYPEMLPSDVRAKVYPPIIASGETQHASR